MKIETTNLDQKAVDFLTEQINQVIKQKEYCNLGLVGGRSVSGVYELLCDVMINWKKVHIFMVDEREVPIDHVDSNFLLAKKTFIDALLQKGLPEKNVHPYITSAGVEKYSQTLHRFGGVLDVLILSAGEDGHIGALYPNHHSIRDDSMAYISMIDSPKPPAARMSASRKLILHAHAAVLFFCGEAKRNAFETFQKDVDPTECPAKLVQFLPQTLVVTDLD